MEIEFDKEIDALLRRARTSGESQIVTGSGSHLDADEIAIFAENALPDKAKQRVTKHLADCGRCRTILSNTIILNAEAVEKTALPEIVADEKGVLAAASVPWYRRFFATQNLAYGLGALAIVFVGMLGFLVVQNSLNTGNSEMAKVSESETVASANTSTSLEESQRLGDQSLNSNLNTEATENLNRSEPRVAQNQMDANNIPPNGPQSTDNTAGSLDDRKADDDLRRNRQPQESNEYRDLQKDKLSPRRDQPAGQLMEGKRKGYERAEASDKSASPESRIAKPAPPPAPNATPANTGSGATTYGGTKNKSSAPVEAEKKERESDSIAAADSDENAATERSLGGKTFTRNGRVWYDSQYRGQQTTNIRRGTSSYKRLDSGLRSITDKLPGAVVLVWKTKAYRID